MCGVSGICSSGVASAFLVVLNLLIADLVLSLIVFMPYVMVLIVAITQLVYALRGLAFGFLVDLFWRSI